METNICSMQIPYSGVVFSVDTLHYISIFCKFYSSIQLTFFSAYYYKKGLYFDQTLCHKVFSDTLSFVTSFFEEIFSQSKNFYENNDIMELSDMAKSGLESSWCME